MSSRRKNIAAVAGFTLIETMIAMSLMGVIIGSLATVTAQWLPNWNRGFARIQRNELVAIALDRLVADLSAAEFIPPNRDTQAPLFEGTELGVTFVRTAVGPNTGPGLEIIRIAEISERDGRVLVRAKTPFAPFGQGPATSAQFNFSDPVVLLRPPYRLSFAYAGRDGLWKNAWAGTDDLPTLIRLTVRDATTENALAISTAALVHVDLPVSAVCGGENCGAAPDNAQQQANANPVAPGIAREQRPGRNR